MKKCFLLLLMLITLVAGTALAQSADGQMPQVIPYPEGLDIKSEGASAAPPEINHQPSRYFTALDYYNCLLYTSPSPRDLGGSRMPSSA